MAFGGATILNTEITVIQVNSPELSRNQFYVILQNYKTKVNTWFGTDSIKKYRYLKTLKKGLKTVNTGYVTRLLLNGVGFKSEIISGTKGQRQSLAPSGALLPGVDILSLRIGKKNPITYNLPECIFATVSKNRVYFWGPNETIVDNFVQLILKQTPVKSGSLIYEKGLSEMSIKD